MTASPREQLADTLSVRDDIGAIALRAGVDARQAANALKARPVETRAFLRLCLASGHDPLPEYPWPDTKVWPQPASFDAPFFGMAIYLFRGANKHSHRQAAKLIDISPATLCRLEKGDRMSVGVVLRAALYAPIHPFAYLKVTDKTTTEPHVSHETEATSMA